MKIGDTVFFKEPNGWFRYEVVSVHEFQDSMTLHNGSQERICKKSEAITVPEFEVMKLKEEQRLQEPRLRAVIDAYNSGIKTSIKIAEHLKIHHLAARGKLLAAHRLQFITLPSDACGFPDPNPKQNEPSVDQPDLG